MIFAERLLNQSVNEKLGGLHSAKIAMVSVDFQRLEILMQQGKWTECGERLADAAQKIEKAGADFLLICTNTTHQSPCSTLLLCMSSKPFV